MAIMPSEKVYLTGNEVAEIATGAITKTAKGLLSPPVKKSSKSNCSRSNNIIAIFCFSDKRSFSGKTNIATRLPATDIPMAKMIRSSSKRKL